MGKQVPVAMLHEDEAEFLSFLRSTADVRIFRSSAPTSAELAVAAFHDESVPCTQFYISNAAFPWVPAITYVSADAPVVERRGWAYISNSGVAPVLEYDRHSPTYGGGRIYWPKFFSAQAASLTYDVAEFERWYGVIARWVRKKGRRAPSESYGHGPYYMPMAWAARGGAA